MNRAESLTEAAIDQHCRLLRLPTIAAQCQRLAKDAVQQQQPYLTYLAELLSAEVDERERHTIERRIKDARLPRIKTLEDFDFSAALWFQPHRFANWPKADISTVPSRSSSSEIREPAKRI